MVVASFFADSPCKGDWRILLNGLDAVPPVSVAPGDPGAELDAAAAAAGFLRPLEFDPARHVAMAEELKHLYTAITRAKCNVRPFSAEGPIFLTSPF